MIFLRLCCYCSVTQLCLALCNPMDCSTSGSSVHGTFHTRILEWIAIFSSRGSSPPEDWTQISCIARGILYQLSHKGSPRILEWVAISASSGSSWPRDWTHVSCIGRQALYLLSHQGSPIGGYHAVCWMNEYIPGPMSVLCLNQTVQGVVAGNLQTQEPFVTLLRCPCHLRGPQTGSHVPLSLINCRS